MTGHRHDHWRAKATVGCGFVDLVLEGELDLRAAPGMSRLLDRLQRLDAVLLVHLRHVEFLDSWGLEPLMNTARHRSVSGTAQVRVCDASRPVRRLLQLVGSTGAVLDVQAWDHFVFSGAATKDLARGTGSSVCAEPGLATEPAGLGEMTESLQPSDWVGAAAAPLTTAPLPGDRVDAPRHGVDRLRRIQRLQTATVVARAAAAETETRWSEAEAAFDAALDDHEPMTVLRALDQQMADAARQHRQARSRADRAARLLIVALAETGPHSDGSDPDSSPLADDAEGTDAAPVDAKGGDAVRRVDGGDVDVTGSAVNDDGFRPAGLPTGVSRGVWPR